MNLSSVAWQWVAYGFGLVVLLAAVAILFFLFRRGLPQGAGSSGDGSQRRRSRLAVVDAFDIDRQRKLLLLRRDGVEHLVMIGGPNDVLIEATIRRVAAQPTRTAAPGLPEPAGPAGIPPSAKQRELPALQQPAPGVRQAPIHGEPPQSEPLREKPRPAASEPPPMEAPQAASLSRRGPATPSVAQPTQARAEPPPPVERAARASVNVPEAMGESSGGGASPQRSRTPDADLAAMAHKLEAALRRPPAAAPPQARPPQFPSRRRSLPNYPSPGRPGPSRSRPRRSRPPLFNRLGRPKGQTPRSGLARSRAQPRYIPRPPLPSHRNLSTPRLERPRRGRRPPPRPSRPNRQRPTSIHSKPKWRSFWADRRVRRAKSAHTDARVGVAPRAV
jgi:flagellar protein FliO/FliZ